MIGTLPTQKLHDIEIAALAIGKLITNEPSVKPQINLASIHIVLKNKLLL